MDLLCLLRDRVVPPAVAVGLVGGLAHLLAERGASVVVRLGDDVLELLAAVAYMRERLADAA
jgi:hypothetical protein